MSEVRPALLIDIGNSRVKWAFARGSRIESGEPFLTRPHEVHNDFLRFWSHEPAPRQVMVANVAGAEIAAELEAWTLQRWRLAPGFAQSQAQAYGVSNGYESPEKLGVDRWVALVGARQIFKDPVCIADCGTAITLDVMDGRGRHLGGLIAPGLSLIRHALTQGTRGLKGVALQRPDELARETAAAIAGGALSAAAGLIERTWRKAAGHLGGEPHL